MAGRTKWTLRVDRLPTRLALGAGAAARPRAVHVNLILHGLADPMPRTSAQRIDLEGICRWITHAWPASPATELLETRANELMRFVFGFDRRVQEARVGVYRLADAEGQALAGVEREATRAQFEAQRRLADGAM
jgi:hypothetical protein